MRGDAARIRESVVDISVALDRTERIGRADPDASSRHASADDPAEPIRVRTAGR